MARFEIVDQTKQQSSVAGLEGLSIDNLAYLALFGSIIAINAYMYLIRNVSPALATSYAYVNPGSRSCWVRDWAEKRCRRLNGWRSA